MKRHLLVLSVLPALACSKGPDPFRVTATTPGQGDRGAIAADIRARFSRSVDPTSVHAGSFSITTGTSSMAGSVSTNGTDITWSGETREPCRAYLVKVDASVRDQSGEPLGQDYYWAFTERGDDCTPATSTATPSGGAFRSKQIVTLRCQDGAGSGCSRIVYTLDGTTPSFSPLNGTLVSLSSPADLVSVEVGDGETQLLFRSEDQAGNIEPVREAPFSIGANGFTYVGTTSGLYRGLGPAPKTFRASPSSRLRPDRIFYDGEVAALYAASDDGLYRSYDSGVTWARSTVAHGLGGDKVAGVYALGSLVYAATSGGLSISIDGGNTFVNRTTVDGLPTDLLGPLYAEGALLYVSTKKGLSLSTDGGQTFVTRTTADGLPSDEVLDVAGDGALICAGTAAGLALSTDGGKTFSGRTTDDGLGDNRVTGVFCKGSHVYAATAHGVASSEDQGATFKNLWTAQGLPDLVTKRVYEHKDSLYVLSSEGLWVSKDKGDSFTAITTANGLGSNWITDLYETDTALYAAISIDLLDNAFATPGVAISDDGGKRFTHHASKVGLGAARVNDIAYSGSTLYIAAGGFTGNLFNQGGLFLSKDGGQIFEERTTADGLPDRDIFSVALQGNRVYVGTAYGLGVSADGGKTFSTRTTANGLGGDPIYRVAVSPTHVYVGTNNGLSISSDGGASFVNRSAAHGLPNRDISDVFLDGSIIYTASYTGGPARGGVAISEDGGSSFVNTPLTLPGGIYASGSLVYVATHMGLYVSETMGALYKPTSLTSPTRCIHVAGSTFYACSGYSDGKVFISSDGGATFETRFVGAPNGDVKTVKFIP